MYTYVQIIFILYYYYIIMMWLPLYLELGLKSWMNILAQNLWVEVEVVASTVKLEYHTINSFSELLSCCENI